MNLSVEIKKFCMNLGLDTVGFTKCRTFHELREFYTERKLQGIENEFEETDIEKRINPNHYMSEGKTIISIAFPYLHNADYIENGFSVYTRGMDYHTVVHSYLEKIVAFINELGGRAVAFTDSNTLPERYIAYLSGVGFIGKNNMIITEKYGSYVFLGEIITDLDIPESTNRIFNDIKYFTKCGSCEICYEECPTRSINKKKKNPNICMSYITQKKEIDDKFAKLMNGRVFGCDSCQKKCPFNRGKEFSHIKEFYPMNFMNYDDVDNIISISNSDFKSSFKITSCGWRGKNVLRRNALIRKALFQNKDIANEELNSPYLEQYKLMIEKLKE
ncbi:tRNA epoxyqueuosine(34) reductase QueG [Clostridium sp. YIM B02505]|uniref:tRNA epoxyqueuosine(34) reductase QueG n=1 Tax=Clostridium yunnanense TaxID=2800325 RepID=A0ABS1EX77_9CLOT|nr:tRNA epoxyqueuosine(34) reductase QueG [Clostridium yunnanense]MBK1813975.1 tRNA epoxyqueuosine(34) reductase QueG [Clostridium yunnanense]